MTTTISVAGLFLALFLLVYLAFKGHSVIIIAPIVAMVAVIFSAGFDSHLMANYTEVYMTGFAKLRKELFPLVFIWGCLCEINGGKRVCGMPSPILSPAGLARKELYWQLSCAAQSLHTEAFPSLW